MNCSRSKNALVTVICLSLASSLFPAESDTAKTESGKDSVVSLDKVVVTATRTKRLMSETPASVSVISEDEIAISPVKNIDDMLQYETGVQVKRVVGMGEGIPSDIIIRGIPGALSATRTLILVDGIPTNASGAPFLILNEVPLTAIKSVEIVRGPYSSLYGANAFGGVINIITKEGYGKPGLHAVFETSYPFTVLHKYTVNEKSMRTSLQESGKETLWNISGITSGGNEKAHYLISGGYRTIGNYLLKDYAITKHDEDTTHKKNVNYDYRDIRFFGKCGVSLSKKVNLEIHGRFFDSDLGFGRTKKILPDSVDIVTRGQKIVAGPIVKFYLNDNVDIIAKAYYRTLLGEFWNEELDSIKDMYVPGYWKSRSHDWQVETRGIIKAGSHQIITAGIEYLGNFIHFGEKINLETDSIIPKSYSADEGIHNTALYIQDEISLFNRLNILPGFRWDYHSDFGSAFSPKLGLSIKIIDWLRFRSSVGRGFRAPTLSELYMPDLTIRSDFVLSANPNLKPEYLWAVDAAFEVLPIPVLKMQVGFFNNNMKDLISQTIDVNTFAVTHDNITNAWSRGLEVELEGQVKHWLTIFGNYVFQKSRNVKAGEDRKMFDKYKPQKNYSGDDLKVPLDYVPEHAFGVGFSIKKAIAGLVLETMFNESFLGKRSYLEWTEVDDEEDVFLIPTDNGYDVYIDPPLIRLKSCWRTDIGIKLTLNNYLWIAYNIQNLFDATFEESGGTLSPGRFASLKIGGGF